MGIIIKACKKLRHVNRVNNTVIFYGYTSPTLKFVDAERTKYKQFLLKETVY